MKTEIYRAIEGFPDYKVSNYGNVMSLKGVSPRILKSALNGSGYAFINLSKEAKVCAKRIHRLVLEVFIGLCPEGMEACHNNGNNQNNRLDNLRWATKRENMADRTKHGTTCKGEDVVCSKVTEIQVLEIRQLRKGKAKLREIAHKYGISASAVGEITNRKTWRHI